LLTSPVALTNTHSVGVVHDALIAAELSTRADGEGFWRTPVVGETWDGVLNDVNGMHVRPEHVNQALADAAAGPVAEGNVGSGTGMICHAFKGGIGTSSRRVDDSAGGYHVGVLVQANHARRERLQINGVSIGRKIPESEVPAPALWTSGGHLRTTQQGMGSIIVIIATDAPLLPGQCDRLAQRATMGIARTGGVGEHFSGDLFLAFATGNRGLPSGDYSAQVPVRTPIEMYANSYMTHLFDGVVEATEEAIVNALFAAETMVGRDEIIVHALPVDRTLEILRTAGQLNGQGG
jgi:D-aminopeptidase